MDPKIQSLLFSRCLEFIFRTWIVQIFNIVCECRRVMILVKAGAPVDATISSLMPLLEPGDIIIDGGNEW